VFLVPVDLVLSQEDLLHDGGDIFAIEDTDSFLFGEPDVHGDSSALDGAGYSFESRCIFVFLYRVGSTKPRLPAGSEKPEFEVGIYPLAVGIQRYTQTTALVMTKKYGA